MTRILETMLGKVVYSKNGRDKGAMFVVVGVVNERLVLLADGDIRKIENPKIKNIKHIQLTRMTADDVFAYLNRGERPDNHIIRKNLKKLQEATEIDGKEVW
ncbi:MAG: RNA-binding protein [Syntrophomonadaceae bacterium]|nr:RNA-binding protein [Syntrophomonadaceae bacterium]